MPKPVESTVHVFLFECHRCGCPLPAAITSHDSNIEQMDARTFTVECSNCKSSGSFIGTEAKRHWVEPWSPSSQRR